MKQKHWQVSVFDKTSEIIRDDTFYTTDTETYLIFELIEKDFTPDTATVTVYNVNGKATINVNVDVSGGIVRYEIPEEAIGHGGVWRTQVIFTKDDEDYTTGIINFDVSGHLLDNTKQKLVAITNWNRFMKHSKELIDDWEQLEEIRQANEQQRELAESARQNEFEANETERQTEFETNETERESTFGVSESVRQVNEQARESAESVRVANEEERISKDSERDSKIDSKADKSYVDNQGAALGAQVAEKVQNFKIKNEVVNGDFSNGITGWSSILNMSLDTTTFGFDTLYANLTNQSSSFSQDIPAITTDKLYVFANYYIVSHITGALRLSARDFGTNSNATLFSLNLSKIGQWQLISGIVSGKINGIRLIENGVTTTASYHVSKIGVVNLTSTFGVGNEPTKEEMDELMKVIPNGWWDDELTLTQKQFITWQLNLIRKNTNAIIALGGMIV